MQPERLTFEALPPNNRSAVTNGRETFVEGDSRTLWGRRYRDLLALHASDLGNPGGQRIGRGGAMDRQPRLQPHVRTCPPPSASSPGAPSPRTTATASAADGTPPAPNASCTAARQPLHAHLGPRPSPTTPKTKIPTPPAFRGPKGPSRRPRGGDDDRSHGGAHIVRRVPRPQPLRALPSLARAEEELLLGF